MRSNFVAGEWIASAEATPNINPSDVSDVIDQYAVGDAAAEERAVSAVPRRHRTCPRWPRPD
jgi:alpha-ketoglutaric semialdehyde dehydrogenase